MKTGTLLVLGLLLALLPAAALAQGDKEGDSVLFIDDFSDPTSGWQEITRRAGTAAYGDGQFVITASLDGSLMWATAGQDFSDLTIEVDATQVLAADNNLNAYGVMCRMQRDDSGYLFQVSGDGYVNITRAGHDDFVTLTDWETSGAVIQGNSTNHIQAVCAGSRLALIVNGETVAEVIDTTYTSGNIALAATTFEEAQPTTIHFDNLVVTGPADSVPLTAETPPGGGLLFQDDFSDTSTGWEVGTYQTGAVGYADGQYFVTSIDMEQFMWGIAGQSFTDTLIEVDATQLSAPSNDNNAYGVMCRVQDDLVSGYLFQVSGDGYANILRSDPEVFESLVSWSTSEAVIQGNSTNHLQVICDGPRLALIVNGELVAETTDTTYTAGDIALTATTFEKDSTEIRFDNLVVSSPAPTVGNTLFADDFSVNSGWFIGSGQNGSSSYNNERLSVISSTDGMLIFSDSDQRFTDVIIDVNASIVRGPANNNAVYGVICRQSVDLSSYYVLLVSLDGYATISIRANEQITNLAEWTAVDAIIQGVGVDNHLQVTCDGSWLTLAVNGKLVLAVEDSTYSEGNIALAVTTFEDETTEVHFDDLVVTMP